MTKRNTQETIPVKIEHLKEILLEAHEKYRSLMETDEAFEKMAILSGNIAVPGCGINWDSEIRCREGRRLATTLSFCEFRKAEAEYRYAVASAGLVPLPIFDMGRFNFYQLYQKVYDMLVWADDHTA